MPPAPSKKPNLKRNSGSKRTKSIPTSECYNSRMVERTSGIDRLNRKAIADGLMLPGKRSLRADFSDKLGEPLSMHELRVYTVIDRASRMKHWTKTDELAELFDADRFTVWAWIN